MHFVQFFQKDLLGDTVEGLGDRAVLILDGRVSLDRKHEWAENHARRYKYVAYQLREGRFSNYTNKSGLVVLNER